MAQEIGDQGAEQSGRRQAELGRLLAAADGYQVVASDGTHLDHVRYERYARRDRRSPARRLPEATPRPSLQCGRDSKSEGKNDRPASRPERARAFETGLSVVRAKRTVSEDVQLERNALWLEQSIRSDNGRTHWMRS
ncbi:MAG TPA: hypothetical protein VK613_12530, partial [Gaiellaceae bacterium]|nr:hypothetical protein [Gaiellaceae bacterium]